ncbi:MAG: hypothetical protein U0174_12150 [Polyangiaceae bacterium]
MAPLAYRILPRHVPVAESFSVTSKVASLFFAVPMVQLKSTAVLDLARASVDLETDLALVVRVSGVRHIELDAPLACTDELRVALRKQRGLVAIAFGGTWHRARIAEVLSLTDPLAPCLGRTSSLAVSPSESEAPRRGGPPEWQGFFGQAFCAALSFA